MRPPNRTNRFRTIQLRVPNFKYDQVAGLSDNHVQQFVRDAIDRAIDQPYESPKDRMVRQTRERLEYLRLQPDNAPGWEDALRPTQRSDFDPERRPPRADKGGTHVMKKEPREKELWMGAHALVERETAYGRKKRRAFEKASRAELAETRARVMKEMDEEQAEARAAGRPGPWDE